MEEWRHYHNNLRNASGVFEVNTRPLMFTNKRTYGPRESKRRQEAKWMYVTCGEVRRSTFGSKYWCLNGRGRRDENKNEISWVPLVHIAFLDTNIF